jgi:hypothetical protein
MPKLVVWGAVSALLLGCGATSTEVTLGDSIVVGVDNAPSGATLVQVRVGTNPCRVTKVAVSWGGDGAPSFLARSGGKETC